jgi:hypothetical protein
MLTASARVRAMVEYLGLPSGPAQRAASLRATPERVVLSAKAWGTVGSAAERAPDGPTSEHQEAEHVGMHVPKLLPSPKQQTIPILHS